MGNKVVAARTARRTVAAGEVTTPKRARSVDRLCLAILVLAGGALGGVKADAATSSPAPPPLIGIAARDITGWTPVPVFERPGGTNLIARLGTAGGLAPVVLVPGPPADGWAH